MGGLRVSSRCYALGGGKKKKRGEARECCGEIFREFAGPAAVVPGGSVAAALRYSALLYPNETVRLFHQKKTFVELCPAPANSNVSSASMSALSLVSSGPQDRVVWPPFTGEPSRLVAQSLRPS